MCAPEDELIREVTINCAERGLLLLRVRDEIRMTIAAYQTLYESSVAFGMRKALQAEQGKSDMERKVSGVYMSIWPSVTPLFQGHVVVILALNSGLQGALHHLSNDPWVGVSVPSGCGRVVSSWTCMPRTDLPLGGSTDPGNVGSDSCVPGPLTQAFKLPHPVGNILG